MNLFKFAGLAGALFALTACPAGDKICDSGDTGCEADDSGDSVDDSGDTSCGTYTGSTCYQYRRSRVPCSFQRRGCR